MVKYPLHHAAKCGDLQRVKELIKLGADVDSRDDHGDTPLHSSMSDRSCKVARYLLRKNCDINARGQSGRTPLLEAAFLEYKGFVDLLLQRGAKANIPDVANQTVLYWASWHGWTDVVQLLISNGEGDVNSVTRNGTTPLFKATHLWREDVVPLLIQAGADVNHSDEDKWTVLHRAAWQDRPRVVQMLLEKEGLNINPRNNYGDTPLHEACESGSGEVVKLLLNAGAATNIKNNYDETAFSRLIIYLLEDCESFPDWAEEVVTLFIQKGAFLDNDDYDKIESSIIKEHVLVKADLCTKLLENKFNFRSLPTVYSNPDFAKSLPPMKGLKLSSQHTKEIKNFVDCEIAAKTFCNVEEARPKVLTMMCVQSLLSYMSSMKRSASQASIGSNPASKKSRLT